MTYQRNVPEYTREEALALGHPTFVLGPSQISMQDTHKWRETYLLNWITDEDQRGKGHGHRLFQAVLTVADAWEVVLVTHPDTPELKATMRRYGFVEDPTRLQWEGKPLMVRLPGQGSAHLLAAIPNDLLVVNI